MILDWQVSEDETSYTAEAEFCTYTVKYDGFVSHAPWYTLITQKEKTKEIPDSDLPDLLTVKDPRTKLPGEYTTAEEAQHACECHDDNWAKKAAQG